MSRRLIVVSPPGERLTLRSDGTLNGETHEGEGYSSVILQADPPRPPQPGPPPPPPDITMTFIAGLPAGLDPARLAHAPVVHGPVSVNELREAGHGAADHLSEFVVLRAGDG